MNKINTSDAIRKADPDFYFEYLHENKDKNFDMAKTKYTFKPEEVAKLKKSHDYWENARLKAWSEKFQESKRKRSSESFEYLL
ncbi:MAG: hypothetical protein GY777_04490 [Candidatus Brocadiaceae bacterium]|nr:hypothetical protein [Candidatus Brocadiaceae bacterium]